MSKSKANGKAGNIVEVTKSDRLLEVKLTDKELAKKHRALLQNVIESQRIEDVLRQEAAEARSDLKELKKARRDLVTVCHKGKETRSVKCRTVRDYRLGELRTYRLDTDEVIEKRALSAGERQPKLPGVEAKPNGGRKPARKKKSNNGATEMATAPEQEAL